MRRMFDAQVGERTVQVSVAAEDGGRLEITLDGQACDADVCHLGERSWSVILDGAVYTIDLEGEPPDVSVHFREHAVPVKLVDTRRKLLAEAARLTGGYRGGPMAIRAPMAGKVVKVLAPKGATVTAGQGLLVVEAMKMENELKSPRDGTVTDVCVKEGQAVEAGEPLATLE
jgi:biotin carboxyl carrier protein